MIHYLTDLEMLKSGSLEKLLNSDSKKERKISIFFDKEKYTGLPFAEINKVLPAARKFSIEFIPVTENTRMFEVGVMIGKRGNNDVYYSILKDPDFTAILKEHEIEPYKCDSPKQRKKIEKKPSFSPNVLINMTSSQKKKDEESISKEKTVHINDVKDADPLPKDGQERKMFISIMNISNNELTDFEGTQEDLALTIAKVMQNVELNNANLEEGLIGAFGEKDGKTILEAIKPNYVFLKNSLTCICRKNQ